LADNQETPTEPVKFDFSSYPEDTLFHERRSGNDRGTETPRPAEERRAKKDRRRRVDPTTFEKQYSEDEMEFMTAMQRFKVQSGKTFPSYGDALRVAHELGYRKATDNAQRLS
jgi:hypothetical protein